MSNQPFMKITLIRKDDGSLLYHDMKPYEKTRVFIAVHAVFEDNLFKFSAHGMKHVIDPSLWDISIQPIL